MSRRVGIIQSNYIPWKGYFDFINMVDDFVLFDDAQYTKRDWRNRNRIKTRHGPQWLTIPVSVSGKRRQKIQDTEIDDRSWARRHWKTLCQHYAGAKHFGHFKASLQELYLGCEDTRLSEINYRFITAVNTILSINTRLWWSRDFPSTAANPSERLLAICRALGAGEYLSGPSARDYLDVALFEREGVKVTWVDYSGYPEYEQLYPPFEHAVSVLDLIFCTGPDAGRYMKTFPKPTPMRGMTS